MAKNKIIFGNEVLIDLTADTVTAASMLSGVIAHDKTGEVIEGSCTYDSDTTDATAAIAEILDGRTAYARGAMLTGTMPNKGAVSLTISSRDADVTIPMGFHDGSGTASINPAEKSKIVAGNIKQGVTILGIEGNYDGESAKAQSKTVTPSRTSQTVQPDAGYDFLSAVTVNAIPYTETPNAAGGTTVTIGA